MKFSAWASIRGAWRFAVVLVLCAPCCAGEMFRWHDGFDVALRAQSPDGSGVTPPLSSPPAAGAYNPFTPPPASSPAEPFVYSPGNYQPGPPPDFAPLYGATGPQPYRLGYTPKMDIGYLPSSHTSPDVGNFSAFEFDSELVFTTPIGAGDGILTISSQFDYHNWRATDSFNHDLFRTGLNLQLASAAGSPFGYQMAFNPSVNSDWHSGLGSESINLDFNGMLFYQMDPAWMFVVGAGYLDRVDNIVIPYAGVVITPDHLWEFRLLFPQGRISRFVGNFWWGSHWMYLAWEYHVESFQVAVPNDSRNQIQMEDYRVTFGLRSDHPGFTKYIEAGYVFGRNVEYLDTLPGFDINDGFIVRGGIRF